ncbi:MAG: alpha/beta hydrolase family protein [Thermoplasmatota archaeon]
MAAESRARRPPALDLGPLRRALEGLPQNPVDRGAVRAWWFRTRRTIDFLGHVKFDLARMWARLDPYPKPFRHLFFRTEDRVPIAGWLGPQHADHPSDWGLVIVPGMFATKDDAAHKARAIRIWRHWRIPVLAIDMRAFGESAGIATAGWKEALDVHGAAVLLAREAKVSRVAVIAESMGGAAAINALAHDAESGTNLMAGGVLCFSAFMDARDAVTYISTKPPKGHPFTPAWDGFRRLLRLKSGGSYERFDEFLDDAARVNGLKGLDELLDLANPKWKVPLLREPILLVHSMDDPVVPVRHARRMERYADGHPNVQVLVTSWGGHTGFEPLDPWWFWEVCRRFFGFVNDCELENLSGANPKPIQVARARPPS